MCWSGNMPSQGWNSIEFGSFSINLAILKTQNFCFQSSRNVRTHQKKKKVLKTGCLFQRSTSKNMFYDFFWSWTKPAGKFHDFSRWNIGFLAAIPCSSSGVHHVCQKEDSSSYHVRFGLLVFVVKPLILWWVHCLFVSLLYLSIYPSIHRSIYPSIHLFVCLSVYLSVCLSIYLYLSILPNWVILRGTIILYI